MRPKVIGLAALLLLQGTAKAAPSALNEGQRFIKEGKLGKAVSVLEQEAHANPGSPEVLLNLGWAYWHAKKLDEAAKIGATLVKLDAQNPVFLVFYANTQLERKRYQDALSLADKALAAGGQSRDASMVKARALFRLEREKEAMGILEDVIKTNPGYTDVLHRKATFLAELGKTEQALTYFEKLSEMDPSNPAYRRGRARALYALGWTEEAKGEWRDLARRGPDTESLLNLGWAYWHEKNLEEAWRIGTMLMRVDDRNPTFLRFVANMEIERQNYPEALRLAQRALEHVPDDRDVSLILTRALFRLDREREAEAVLKRLIRAHPDHPGVKYHWADYIARVGRHEEALAAYDELIKVDPLSELYRMGRANALYQLGQFDKAVAEWRFLAVQQEPSLGALSRLRDDAFNRRAWDEALKWQEEIIAVKPSDPRGWERLSQIYAAMKSNFGALEAAESAIEADPLAIHGYYLRAEALQQLQDWPAMRKAYEDILRRNPNSVRALEGLSYALEAQGDYAGARETAARIQKITLPSVSGHRIVHEARLLADQGKLDRARALLRKLDKARGAGVPALLYHGISRHDRSDSIPQENFRRQMQALKKAGFSPITVAEFERYVAGKGTLPKKPVMITFDDGRVDSFENADPVLKETGFKATMFVHLSTLRRPHFHSSPEDVRKWLKTGRWDIQAHGFEAHDPMPLDAAGREGHFLANRKWLAREKRLETLEEYRKRLDGEYKKAKQMLEEVVPGKEITAFAYPYGDYGRTDYTNTPQSAAFNQELVRKHFKLAFVQEQFGFNLKSSNPTDLKRLEVTRHMTPEQLVGHLSLGDPWVQAQLMEAELRRRAGQIGLADAVYDGLEQEGINDPRLWAERGIALRKIGAVYDAQRLFAKADKAEAGEGRAAERYRRLFEHARAETGPQVGAEIKTRSDNYSVNSLRMILRSGASVRSARVQGWYGRGSFSDRLDPHARDVRIEENEAGLGVRWFPNPKLEINAAYARRFFSSSIAGANNYSASLGYQAAPQLRLGVRDGANTVDSATAIRRGRSYHLNGAELVWDPAFNWRASANFDVARYNDSNTSAELRMLLTRRLAENIALGAAVLRGDSTRPTPEYYTPRGLTQYSGFLTYNQGFGRRSDGTGQQPAEVVAQYEGGYGYQRARSRSVHAVKAALIWRVVDHVSFAIGGRYAHSPSYISRELTSGMSLSY